MTDSSTNFEHQLQQLKPTSCDERLPEAFYRAGWEACERANAIMLPKNPGGKRLPSFSGGLLCGLFVAVGVAALSHWAHDSEPRQRIAAPDFRDSEPTITQNDEAGGFRQALNQSDSSAAASETNTPSVDWKSLADTFSPWGYRNTPAFEDTIPAAARPLSIAAREHWSCLVVAEQTSSRRVTEVSTPGPATAEHESPLRTFPATEEHLRELL